MDQVDTGVCRLNFGLGHRVTLSHRTASTADLASMRRKDSPFLGSVTVTPVFLRAASSASGLRPGWAESMRAATPAATGQAWDVPTKVDTPPPMPAEVTGAPGASTSTWLSLFEKQGMRSAGVVASVHPKEMVPASAL